MWRNPGRQGGRQYPRPFSEASGIRNQKPSGDVADPDLSRRETKMPQIVCERIENAEGSQGKFDLPRGFSREMIQEIEKTRTVAGESKCAGEVPPR